MYDVIIIGAGIIGSFIAYNLSKYQIKILILEKDEDVCNGVSKANSAIIHSGYDPLPGTLKAKLNVSGNRMYEKITDELNVEFKRIGSYTLAFNKEEENEIKILYERGRLNGVKTEIIGKDEILTREPNVNDNVLCGMYAESTGILSPWDMIYALLDNVIQNGNEVKTNEEVTDIKKSDNIFYVKTKSGIYQSRFVINAAGLFADSITGMVTKDIGFRMLYTRGEYYVIDKDYENYVKSVIFRAPDDKGKGVLVTPTVCGNILLGPTSFPVENEHMNETTKQGLNEIKEKINSMMKNPPFKGIIRSFSGIRPKTDSHDFIIEEIPDVNNFIQAAGIESPGLASAPAIALMIEEMILNKEKLKLKTDYAVYPQKHIRINKLSPENINELIKINPKYGRIVCRCEKITEGEIIDAIRSPLGVHTLDGIKRRVRAGFGRCQGGFCQPLLINIIARELGLKKTDILLNNTGSNILIEETPKGVRNDEK